MVVNERSMITISIFMVGLVFLPSYSWLLLTNQNELTPFVLILLMLGIFFSFTFKPSNIRGGIKFVIREGIVASFILEFLLVFLDVWVVKHPSDAPGLVTGLGGVICFLGVVYEVDSSGLVEFARHLACVTIGLSVRPFSKIKIVTSFIVFSLTILFERTEIDNNGEKPKRLIYRFINKLIGNQGGRALRRNRRNVPRRNIFMRFVFRSCFIILPMVSIMCFTEKGNPWAYLPPTVAIYICFVSTPSNTRSIVKFLVRDEIVGRFLLAILLVVLDVWVVKHSSITLGLSSGLGALTCFIAAHYQVDYSGIVEFTVHSASVTIGLALIPFKWTEVLMGFVVFLLASSFEFGEGNHKTIVKLWRMVYN